MAPLLEIKGLIVQLYGRNNVVEAVRGLNLSVERGEIHALVGESGCGKSVSAKTVLRLFPEKRFRASGSIGFGDIDNVLTLSPRELPNLRGKRIALVSQDPHRCFTPLIPLGEQIRECIALHRGLDYATSRALAIDYIASVGLEPAEVRYRSFAHELSGGMLQRMSIAMALSGDPELLIADEATTALDVTIQAQIIALLTKIRRERGISILFITHNLALVSQFCDRLSIMYAGRVVESGPAREILADAAHPYTRALVRCLPEFQTPGSRIPSIPGSPPSLGERIAGCAFAPRCTQADALCLHMAPATSSIGREREVACHCAGVAAGVAV